MIRSLLVLSLLFSISSAQSEIRISAGSKTGFYYEAASYLCKKVRQKGEGCKVIESSGSTANLINLFEKVSDFSFVPSNKIVERSLVHYNLKEGSQWKSLRVVKGLSFDPLVLIVTKDKTLVEQKDFKDLRVFVSSFASTKRLFVDQINPERTYKPIHYSLKDKDNYSSKLDNRDYKNIVKKMKKDIVARSKDFCGNKIDAMVLESATDQRLISYLREKCSAKVVDLRPFLTNDIFLEGFMAKKYRNLFEEGEKVLIGKVDYLVSLNDVDSKKKAVMKSVVENDFQKWVDGKIKSKSLSKSINSPLKDLKFLESYIPPVLE